MVHPYRSLTCTNCGIAPRGVDGALLCRRCATEILDRIRDELLDALEKAEMKKSASPTIGQG